jgi:hypothetical protein
MKNTYVKINGKSMPVVFTRRARENAVLNFQDNVLFVLEACGDSLIEDKVLLIRNYGFDYDLKVLISSDTEEIVVLDFKDINERIVPDIDFSLESMLLLA